MEALRPANLNLPARNVKNFTYEHGLSNRQPLQLMRVEHMAGGQTVNDDEDFIDGSSVIPSPSELQILGADNDHLTLWVGMLPQSYGTGVENIPHCSSALPVVIRLGDEMIQCYALVGGDQGIPRCGVDIKFEKVFFFPEYCTLGLTNAKARKEAWKQNIAKLKSQAQESFDIASKQGSNPTTQPANIVARDMFLRLKQMTSAWSTTRQPFLLEQIDAELTQMGHASAYNKLSQLSSGLRVFDMEDAELAIREMETLDPNVHKLLKLSGPNLLVNASTAIVQRGIRLSQYELPIFLHLFYLEYQRKDSADHPDLFDGDEKLQKLTLMADKAVSMTRGSVIPSIHKAACDKSRLVNEDEAEAPTSVISRLRKTVKDMVDNFGNVSHDTHSQSVFAKLRAVSAPHEGTGLYRENFELDLRRWVQQNFAQRDHAMAKFADGLKQIHECLQIGERALRDIRSNSAAGNEKEGDRKGDDQGRE